MCQIFIKNNYIKNFIYRSRSNSLTESIITTFASSRSSSPNQSIPLTFPTDIVSNRKIDFESKSKQHISSVSSRKSKLKSSTVSGIEDKENINNVKKEENYFLTTFTEQIENREESIEMKAEKTKNKSKKQVMTTKFPGRQTNNSLSSLTGNIVIQNVEAPPQPPPPKKVTQNDGANSRKKKVKSTDM